MLGTQIMKICNKFARNKTFICGNWKSNNTSQQSLKIVNNITNKLQFDPLKVDVVIAPPAIHIPSIRKQLKHPNVKIASQTCSSYGLGAYTGELAIQHLRQFGTQWVIIGHSERRLYCNQNDDMLFKKAQHALSSKMKVIFCIGETIQQAGKVEKVLQTQTSNLIKGLPFSTYKQQWLNSIVLAYEPVWAIGTGNACSPQQALDVFKFLRYKLPWNHGQTSKLRMVYGGSANAKNTSDYMSIDLIDGLLVGGASLKEEFRDMVKKCSQV